MKLKVLFSRVGVTLRVYLNRKILFKTKNHPSQSISTRVSFGPCFIYVFSYFGTLDFPAVPIFFPDYGPLERTHPNSYFFLSGRVVISRRTSTVFPVPGARKTCPGKTLDFPTHFRPCALILRLFGEVEILN